MGTMGNERNRKENVMFSAVFFILFVVIAGSKSNIPPETVPWIMTALAVMEVLFWWKIFGQDSKDLYEKNQKLEEKIKKLKTSGTENNNNE